MRPTIAVALCAAFVALCPSPASAQAAPAKVAAGGWVGKSVMLTRVDHSRKSAACPTLKQIDHYVREVHLKWDEPSKGCRFILSGNFTNGRVLEEDGSYMRVEFAQTAFPKHPVTLWVPTRNFKVKS